MLVIIGFPKLGPQSAITAKAAQRLCSKEYFASRTPLPSQIIQAPIMALYAVAVTAFALASQVSQLASSELLDIMELTPLWEGGELLYGCGLGFTLSVYD